MMDQEATAAVTSPLPPRQRCHLVVADLESSLGHQVVSERGGEVWHALGSSILTDMRKDVSEARGEGACGRS